MTILVAIISLLVFVLFTIGLVFFLIMMRRFAKRKTNSLFYTQFQVKVPRYNEVKPESVEGLFTSLYSIFRYGVHGLFAGQEHIGFEIVSQGGIIKFFHSHRSNRTGPKRPKADGGDRPRRAD